VVVVVVVVVVGVTAAASVVAAPGVAIHETQKPVISRVDKHVPSSPPVPLPRDTSISKLNHEIKR
jgi:hypothetical protein